MTLVFTGSARSLGESQKKDERATCGRRARGNGVLGTFFRPQTNTPRNLRCGVNDCSNEKVTSQKRRINPWKVAGIDRGSITPGIITIATQGGYHPMAFYSRLEHKNCKTPYSGFGIRHVVR